MDRRIPCALITLLLASCDGGGVETRTVAAPPPLPPLSGRLAVSVDDDIAVVGADGSGRRVVVEAPGPQFDADWSPDGAHLAYRDSRTGVNVNDEIYVSSADGTGARNLTASPSNEWSPAWAPDGGQIAFASDREGELRIFVMHADGSGLRQLTETPAYDMYPAWSPDGTQIAFHSTRSTPESFEAPERDPERTADYDVFVVPAEGGRARNLSRDLERQQRFPDWSPDGRWLAVDEEGSVAFVPTDGSARVSRPGLVGGFPAWAPD